MSGEREVPGAPAAEESPTTFLLLELSLYDGRLRGEEADGALGARAEEAAPGGVRGRGGRVGGVGRGRGGAQLEDVEEAGGAQLGHQHLLLLGGGEGAGDEGEEGLVLALKDVPAVLEAGDGGVARGERGGVARLQREEHEVYPDARRARAHGEGGARVQAVRPAAPARELQPRLLLRPPLWKPYTLNLSY